MKPEHYRRKRKERPKRKSRSSTAKRRMLATVQERKTITSPQLREDYSTKTEWAKKLIPKLKTEAS
jgi:predicted HTH transcriptional regulator